MITIPNTETLTTLCLESFGLLGLEAFQIRRGRCAYELDGSRAGVYGRVSVQLGGSRMNGEGAPEGFFQPRGLWLAQSSKAPG